MKIKDLKDFPKALLKEDEIHLYKAFKLLNLDDEMKININIDLLSLSEEIAVSRMINEMNTDELSELTSELASFKNDNTTPTIISFAKFIFDKNYLLERELVDQGEIYFKDGVISITLNDKEYEIDVYDKYLTDINIEISETDEKTVSSINLKDI